MSDDKPDMPVDQSVGYRKPPSQSRFPKGKSGNPKGRPKGSCNLATLVEKAFSERISVTIKGKPRKIEKREAMIMRMANLAVSGDFKALRLSTELMHRFEQPGASGEAPAFRVLDADDAVWEGVLERLKQRGLPIQESDHNG